MGILTLVFLNMYIMKSLLVILILLPILGFAQRDYLYQFHDFRHGNQTDKLDLQNQDIYYTNKIPYAQKSSGVTPINLGYGFSNSMYDKNMSGAYDVIQTDSFYYIAGRTRNGAGSLANNELMFSMKIDLQGNVLWRRTDSLVDANHWDIYYGHALTQLSNGDFAQVAFYPKYDTVKKFQYVYPLISKFNENGSLISKFVMNYDSIPEWNDSITFLPYGGVFSRKNREIVLFGNLTSKSWCLNASNGNYEPDTVYIGICNIDSNLNYLNYKRLFMPQIGGMIIVYNGEKTSDKGYLLTIHSYLFYKDFVLKLDSNFNYEWHNEVGDSVLEYWNPVKAIESKNGGYLYVREYPVDKMDYYGRKQIAYGKISKQGALLWEKKCELFPDTAQPWNRIYKMPMGIIEQENGDILFSNRINIDRGAGLVRTDSLGNIKWYRWILGMYGDVGNQTHAGGMFLYNMRKPVGEGALLVGHAGYGKAQLIRTDSLGCTLPNCLDTNLHLGIQEFEQIQKQELILYPNPVHDQLQIAINQQGVKVEQVIIYDINGREILNKSYNDYLVNINVSSYTTGLYIVKISGTDGREWSRKFIKE